MPTYGDDPHFDLALLHDLRARCGFTARSPEELAGQVHGARWLVTAWDGERLIGFARAISDGVTNAYISSVMVDEAWRRRGVGRELLRRLMDGRGPAMRWVLHARAGAIEFYRALGFTPGHDVMWRGRLSG